MNSKQKSKILHAIAEATDVNPAVIEVNARILRQMLFERAMIKMNIKRTKEPGSFDDNLNSQSMSDQNPSKPSASKSTLQNDGDSDISKQKKSPGRPKKARGAVLTYQLGARISDPMFSWLLKIAKYEGLEYTELVREFIRAGINRYKQDPFFLDFIKEEKTKSEA